MKLKLLFLLIGVFLLFYSCDEPIDTTPSNENCSSNSECREKYTENHICYDQVENPKDPESSDCPNSNCYCVTNRCETDNRLKCEAYGCILNRGAGQCNCPENTFYKSYSEYGLPSECLPNYTCKNSYECYYIGLITRSGIKGTKSCVSDGKCSDTCKDDFDCYAENERCFHSSDGKSLCREMKEIDCNTNEEYSNPYDYTEMGYMLCSKYCNNDTDCLSGFRCNNDKHCTPLCLNNQDCENDKFSVGNICDSDLNYCIKE